MRPRDWLFLAALLLVLALLAAWTTASNVDASGCPTPTGTRPLERASEQGGCP